MNIVGFGESSNVILIQAGYMPDAPGSVSTESKVDDILIKWKTPISNGVPVTQYYPMIEGANGEFNLMLECQLGVEFID